MNAPKPSFTDVDKVKVVCRVDDRDGHRLLFVDELTDDGHLRPILALNKFDASQLGAACNLYMQEIIAHQFNEVAGMMTSKDRTDLFADDDDD